MEIALVWSKICGKRHARGVTFSTAIKRVSIFPGSTRRGLKASRFGSSYESVAWYERSS
jgi:hypothetical protein